MDQRQGRARASLGLIPSPVITTTRQERAWYKVIKTVKGHRYAYWQRAWREGGRVRTVSIYVGPAAAGWGAPPSRDPSPGVPGPRPAPHAPVITTATSPLSEPELIEQLFSGSVPAAFKWTPPWSGVHRPEDCAFQPDPRIAAMHRAMGIVGQSIAWPGKDGTILGIAGAWHRNTYEPERLSFEPWVERLQIPDHTRFASAEEHSLTWLHELAHATRTSVRSPRSDNNYAQEEVAELTANLVARRLGYPRQDTTRSRCYIRGWLEQCPYRNRSRTFAKRHAQRAADYLMSLVPPDITTE